MITVKIAENMHGNEKEKLNKFWKKNQSCLSVTGLFLPHIVEFFLKCISQCLYGTCYQNRNKKVLFYGGEKRKMVEK